jgi:hypothetical protein
VSIYTQIIIDAVKCSPEEAPLVEGLLRVTYGTLDGLDRAALRREGKKCLAAVRADVELARDVAKSFGLMVAS